MSMECPELSSAMLTVVRLPENLRLPVGFVRAKQDEVIRPIFPAPAIASAVEKLVLRSLDRVGPEAAS